MDTSQLTDINYFYYYGSNDIQEETQHDLMLLLLQPQRSLFYNRTEGAGVADKYNYPNALSLQIGLRYDIAMAIADRNTKVTNGNNNTIDRRVGASQFSVDFQQNDSGDSDVSVYYFLYTDYKNFQNITLPVGKI